MLKCCCILLAPYTILRNQGKSSRLRFVHFLLALFVLCSLVFFSKKFPTFKLNFREYGDTFFKWYKHLRQSVMPVLLIYTKF